MRGDQKGHDEGTDTRYWYYKLDTHRCAHTIRLNKVSLLSFIKFSSKPHARLLAAQIHILIIYFQSTWLNATIHIFLYTNPSYEPIFEAVLLDGNAQSMQN